MEIIYLSQVLKQKEQKKFVNSKQITLNYCQIQFIDLPLPKIYQNIQKLHLSHNLIETLPSFEELNDLSQLSLAFNKIKYWQEFENITQNQKITYLSVKGNSLENNPNYQYEIVLLFPGLQKLDDVQIDYKLRQGMFKFQKKVSKQLIPFIYQLELIREHLYMIEQKMKVHKEMEQMYQFSQNPKWNLFDFDYCLQILEHIQKCKGKTNKGFLNYIIDQMCPDIQQRCQKNYNRQKINKIYKELFDEVILEQNKRYDKSMQKYLFDVALAKNSCIQNDSQEILGYILLEFYKLQPTQSQIDGIVCLENKNHLLNQIQQTVKSGINGFQIKEQQAAQNLEITSSLDVIENDPKILKNLLLIHFPIFPMNQSYIQDLTEIIKQKLYQYENQFQRIQNVMSQMKIDLIQSNYEESQKVNFSKVTPRKTEMKSPSITKPMITTPNKGNLCSSDVKELKKTALLKKSSLDLQKIKLKFLQIFLKITQKQYVKNKQNILDFSLRQIKQYSISRFHHKQLFKKTLQGLKQNLNNRINFQKSLYDQNIKCKAFFALVKLKTAKQLMIRKIKRFIKRHQKKMLNIYFNQWKFHKNLIDSSYYNNLTLKLHNHQSEKHSFKKITY